MFIISIPTVISCGKSSVIAFTICGIISTTTLTKSGSTFAIPLITPSTLSIRAGSKSAISGGSSFNINGKVSLISPLTRSPSPLITVLTRGIRLLATVTILSTNSDINPLKSALSSAIPVSKFCQAAPIAAVDPLIVSAASCAVVPVIPISVCTTCIASYTSLRLLISYLTPLSFSASAKSLCISSFVPP